MLRDWQRGDKVKATIKLRRGGEFPDERVRYIEQLDGRSVVLEASRRLGSGYHDHNLSSLIIGEWAFSGRDLMSLEWIAEGDLEIDEILVCWSDRIL